VIKIRRRRRRRRRRRKTSRRRRRISKVFLPRFYFSFAKTGVFIRFFTASW
jgi:hypothetical protein